jgi:hypothetical protein
MGMGGIDVRSEKPEVWGIAGAERNSLREARQHEYYSSVKTNYRYQAARNARFRSGSYKLAYAQ